MHLTSMVMLSKPIISLPIILRNRVELSELFSSQRQQLGHHYPSHIFFTGRRRETSFISEEIITSQINYWFQIQLLDPILPILERNPIKQAWRSEDLLIIFLLPEIEVIVIQPNSIYEFAFFFRLRLWLWRQRNIHFFIANYLFLQEQFFFIDRDVRILLAVVRIRAG